MNSLEPQTDQELVSLLIQDNTRAFEELYARYKTKLNTFCLYLLKSETLSEDIVQDTFLKLWTGRKDLDPACSFSSYVYTTVRNKALNELRSSKRKNQVEAVLQVQKEKLCEKSPDFQLILEEYEQILSKAILQLPEYRRRIFTMSRYEGLSHKEIAKELGISSHTVQSHISQSIRLIRYYFLKHADMQLIWLSVILLGEANLN